ncbi:MAG TPA: PhzF family phenazine biosynthesis protein [Holophaga sp.]|nr:PhzF family phenazine biosynthesis protein [Holophaga sp.]HPS66676.1 PhzF family phenazine biosynthesis protein [Holophaga sp.]
MSYLDVALTYWQPGPGPVGAWPRVGAPASRSLARKLKFKKIDAFATSTASGNPAAAVYLESLEHLSCEEMQKIARDLKGFVSEVGYVTRISRDTFRLKYFSSEKEVEFCGHTTLAIVNDLVMNDSGLKNLREIHLHTNKEVLSAEISREEPQMVYVQVPDPVCSGCGIGLAEICEALRLPKNAIDPGLKIGIVNAGNQTLCVPLKTLRRTVDCAPDFEALRRLCDKHGLDAVVVFTSEVSDPANRYRTRVFVAPLGYLEDPATGSVNAALGYYLYRSRKWDGSRIRIEQNGDLDHPNIVTLSTRRASDGTLRIVFGGGAIVRLEGQYSL